MAFGAGAAFKEMCIRDSPSLVVRVRRFTNSRNIVGIASSHTQIILSILTSISMLF